MIRARNVENIGKLGKSGEERARELLWRHGFVDIHNLNDGRQNYPDVDLLATKDGRRFCISVKTRNKYTNKNTLNNRYKLENKSRKLTHAAATAAQLQAELAWLVIQVDRDSFSAYFGTQADIPRVGSGGRRLTANAILMDEAFTSRYLCLAKDEPHGFNYSEVSNHPEDWSR
jgi:Holliday junction resolvase-like predicted endonuclease